jgi:succinate-semialdehyde dehydrogenase/glutarate-semialdehyde dehydrogenase
MANTATSTNPATGKKIADYNRISEKEAAKKIEKSHKAWLKWKKTSFKKRAKLMLKAADILDENREAYAKLATQEMGKMIGAARSEIKKCALICRHYAEHAEAYLADEIIETEATKSYISYQPQGVILAVMPWNFPFYQVIRFIVPALMAGNGGVLKHASNVQGCAFKLEEIFAKAGFPKGLFANLNVSSDAIEKIIENERITAVTLTGSEPAGRAVAATAGKNLKKTVLELGGADAYIVLQDADLEMAATLLTKGRLQNNGQTCIAAKRMIIVDKIYDDFLELYKKKMKKAKMGDPMNEDNFFGPMARHDLRDELHEQVKKSINQGAKLVLGGKIPKDKGAYYPATILAEVQPGMEAFDEELFGPVASVIRAKDEKHAIELANNSKFGLGSGVITSDKKRGEKVALQLEAGNSFVNKLTASDPRLPFGGVKNSGYGRELYKHGIREFMNTKTIWVD